MEYTLSIIKPDAMKRGLQDKILKMIEGSKLKILIQKTEQLTLEKAQNFYAIHKERPFFDELCKSMITAPVSIQVLYGENAIAKYRQLMGATNPSEAADGTIRKTYGLSIGDNSIHGSDSKENAEYEILQMFNLKDLIEAGRAQ